MGTREWGMRKGNGEQKALIAVVTVMRAEFMGGVCCFGCRRGGGQGGGPHRNGCSLVFRRVRCLCLV